MSLFDHLEGLGFDEKEIALIAEWREALKAHSDEGKAIEKICQLETRMKDEVRTEFLRRIISNWQQNEDAIRAIHEAVSTTHNLSHPDPLLLQGPHVGVDLPEMLGRIVTYQSFRDFLGRYANQTLNEFPNKKQVKSGERKIIPQELPGLYANASGFIWATDTDELDSTLSLDELCYRLGLYYLKGGELLLEMTYPRASVHRMFNPNNR